MTARSLPVRRTRIIARQFLHRSLVGQGLLIMLFWLAGQEIAKAAHLPVPGGVIGLFLVLALLASGKLQLGSMRRGAKWFIAELLLFFIPAVLAVMDHREFIGLIGLKIIAVILTGTVAVMVSTALAVDFGYRWLLRREEGLRHAAE